MTLLPEAAMTTVSATNSAAPSTAPYTPAAAKQFLGQDDFLKLMTAQLKNQDPMAPMNNAEFMGQMAQFSTVQGIGEVNTTLGNIDGEMRNYRIATGATMLGHQVLVPSTITRPDANGSVAGVVDLPESSDSVVISYSDAETGQLLHSDALGAQPPGLLGFGWDAIPEDIRAANRPIQVTVQASNAAGTQDVGPQVYAKVYAAQAATSGGDLTFQVEDYGAVNALEVDGFR
ncbi:MAG TPA: flagellar biosynthesis protein FlgD [Rhodobacter sp.]|jgi:flagellar basal-body rod modification protein FlgD|nr:flagellar biosynthesis protein FlgD [Rhodobacter sp.]